MVCGGQDNSETDYLIQTKLIDFNNVLNKLALDRRKLINCDYKQNGNR